MYKSTIDIQYSHKTTVYNASKINFYIVISDAATKIALSALIATVRIGVRMHY